MERHYIENPKPIFVFLDDLTYFSETPESLDHSAATKCNNSVLYYKPLTVILKGLKASLKGVMT